MTSLGRIAESTPDDRDRVVDAARAFSIVVVVLWHWTVSVTFRTESGALAMANPLHVVPGGWVITWVFQVMTVFFLVGGYVNGLGWARAHEGAEGARRFVGRRLRRLARPTAVWAGVWITTELLAAALPGEHRWIWQWFPGYLTPLWFLAVYALLITAAPLTATAHQRHPVATLALLAGLVAAGTVLDVTTGWSWVLWAIAPLVWVFVHQLGYAWRSWDLGRRSLPVRLGIAAVGLAALLLLTGPGGYPRPLVATIDTDGSNLLPTNATVAALAVFQLGLLALATPALDRALRRDRWWRPVVAVNATAMTIFLWHMSALLVVIWGFEALGGVLIDAPTAAWWAQRPLWLLAPAAVLAAFVALVGRVERPRS
ncbi:peptidoglycan/LPS O-acetylase OafA/YrhL [Kineosphaera limosa]|nr:acyltransferase [Kineosphaera limosa]NYE02416.1 peptidoglycan/LPS O-acetylase OafA/YrhL [Kineosphaera limosa]